MYTMEYYSFLKRKKILPFVTTWTYIESITLSETCQIDKDKYCMTSLTCRIYKYQTHRNRPKNSGLQGLRDEGNGEILVRGYKRSII